MTTSQPSPEDLLAEISDLRNRLAEAEDTLRAIREGEVDALVVYGSRGEQIYTLKGADSSYRILIEAINEGAGILALDGDILYANQKLSEVLGTPQERLVGTRISDYTEVADQELLTALLEHGRQGGSKGEVSLRNRYGVIVPAYLSFRSFNLEEAPGAVCMVVTDLTQQKRQEIILAEEQLSRAIFEQVEAVILVVDPEGRILRASHEAHQICRSNLLLRHFDEVIRLAIFDTAGGERGPAAYKPLSIRSILQGKIFYGLEVRLYPPEGWEPLEMLLNAGPLRGRQGEVMGAVVALTDITKRKRVEEALKAAHDQLVSEKNRLEAVMDALPVGVAILNERGGHVRSNTMFERIWGSRHPLSDKVADYSAYQAWWADTGKPVQPEEWASACVVKKGETVIGQCMEIEGFDGTHRFVLNSAAPILDAEGKVTECAVAILDITKLKQAEKALKQAHDELEQRVKDRTAELRLMVAQLREEVAHRLETQEALKNSEARLRRLSSQLLAAQEGERKRLAAELHDELGHALLTIKLQLRALERGLIPAQKPLAEDIGALQSFIDGVLDSVRRLYFDLSPGNLEDLGLTGALRQILDGFAREHQNIHWQIRMDNLDGEFPLPTQTSIYRIMQEILTNIGKHAKPSRVSVRVKRNPTAALFTVDDNGCGFDTSRIHSLDDPNRGLGLVAMEERVRIQGGTLEIISRENQGTRITFTLPLGSGRQ